MFITEILGFVSSLGNTSVEVYEWKEVDVRSQRLANSPSFSKLTKKRANLQFSGWRLAHAVVKADYLDRRNLTMPGVGFLLQSTNLIDFAKSPMELKAGASKTLNDFSLSSLSGRVGQGLALLYGHSLGLTYTAHLSSFVNAQPAGSPSAIHKSDAMADFLFAGKNGTVLLESKGSFTSQKNDPSALKTVLKRALTKQIDPWMIHIQPAPSNGYVVYSCLREGSWDPSALFVVDPAGEDNPAARLNFDREEVMRENYGAWLRAMGVPNAAARLMHSARTREDILETTPETTDFIVYEHQGRSFAALGDPYLNYPYLELDVPMIGIDVIVLQAISEVIRNRDVRLSDILDDPPAQESEQTSASIFPDGSFMGVAIPSDGISILTLKL